ncbi:peptide/nickel transport system permease protein [Aequitasia blattaphilus]|uniref:ABC transporter permease n=3 Tax=Lachnospirales TaxID=3085636 RepID=A0ABT1ENV2_9FIRM|nr:ABC transporter permease [Aequitasia blattaphilus]MCP1111391.1 ABC transporter permease [Ohessyouella blattaphilus]MCR8564785.1 ABC transporter permease [Ohessyouella blattaphilus]MCR8613664.1 ABC transporter permease [Aequitasia blattaphilus]
MFGLFFVIALLILSLLSPYICRYGYQEIVMKDRFSLPSWNHLLGCDEVGRDILSRILFGAKYTLSIGILSVALSCVAGVILGSISGYFGGVVDTLIMRFLDVFQAFPNILLAIAISAVLGTGFDKVIYAIGISGIPNFARMMRANILTVRNAEFVEAATSINCSTFRIIRNHVIPNAISPLIVQVAMGIASSALAASGLSFLGFGVQAPTPEWGAMLASARGYMRDYPHMVIIPGLFIMLTVLSFNLVGDSIRDALDPKLRD